MCTALKLSLVTSWRPVLCRAFARVRGFGRQPAIESVLQLIILLLTGGLKFCKWLQPASTMAIVFHEGGIDYISLISGILMKHRNRCLQALSLGHLVFIMFQVFSSLELLSIQTFPSHEEISIRIQKCKSYSRISEQNQTHSS